MRYKFLAWLAALSLAVPLGGMASAQSVQAAGYGGAGGGFVDLGHASWAARYVILLHLEGVVHGMGNGYFQPNHDLTWAQAVAMVDHYVGAHPSQGPSLSGAVPGGVRSGLGRQWFRRDVEYAFRRGWLAQARSWGGYIDRADFARLVFHSLQMPRLSSTQVDQVLSAYADASQIPARDRQGVAVLSQDGILHGFRNGTFRPLSRLTRAQAAVILSKAELLRGDQTGTGQVLQGTLTVVSATPGTTPGGAGYQGTVTVQAGSGSATTYYVDTAAAVFLNGQASSLAALVPGDQVNLYLDAGGNVAYLSATAAASAPTATEQGVVLQAGTGGVLQIYSPSTGVTQVTLSTATGAAQAAALSPGDEVELQGVSNGQASGVSLVQAAASYQGTVENPSASGFLLVQTNGTALPVTPAAGAYVEAGGSQTELSALSAGTAATVFGWSYGNGLQASLMVIG